MRRLSLALPVVVFALGLVACGDDGGDAPAAERAAVPTLDPAAAAPTETPTPEPTATPESGTTDLQPCELLTPEDLETLGVPAGVEDEVGLARMCQWQASGKHTVSAGIFDDLGLGDVVSRASKTRTSVGSHDAVRYWGPLGVCAIAIGVTESSRVDVSGVAGGDRGVACRVAKQAAALVEAKLP